MNYYIEIDANKIKVLQAPKGRTLHDGLGAAGFRQIRIEEPMLHLSLERLLTIIERAEAVEFEPPKFI